MDILPTLCVITGSKLPARKIDGVDCSEFLLGKTSKSPRNTFYYYFYDDQLMAVRYKTWKLVLPHQSQAYTLGTMGKGGFPGESKKGNPVGLGLYNLLNDPGESYNVAALYPEVVKQILVYVEEARADLGDGLTKRTGKNLRQPAMVGP